MAYAHHGKGAEGFGGDTCLGFDFGPESQEQDISLSQILAMSDFNNFSGEVPLSNSFFDLSTPGSVEPIEPFMDIPGTTTGPSAGDLAIKPEVVTAGPNDTNEAVCLEEYPGDFKFEVLPAAGNNYENSKLRYHYKTRKMFCKLGTHDFHVKMDFKSIHNPQDYQIRACVVYTDPEHRDKAVQKCLTCISVEKKDTQEGDDYILYFIRAPKEDKFAEHWRSDVTGRYYVFVPLKNPEPGSDHLVQNMNFSCLSSCKSTGMHRRASSIVFTLLNKQKEVRGRSVIGLRVCSAPTRDFKCEFGKAGPEIIQRTDRVGRVKKLVGKGMKKRRQAIKQEPVTPPAVEAPSQITSMVAWKHEESDTEHFEMPSSQEQSSSQETVFTDSENMGGPASLRLKKLLRDSRAVLAMQRSKIPSRRLLASHLFTTLKMAQDVCALSRKNELHLISLRQSAE